MTKTNEELQEIVDSLKKSLETAQNSLAAAQKWIHQLESSDLSELPVVEKSHTAAPTTDSENIFYGIYNGKEMVSETGRSFPVPANYASKSKLIEGDSLKMTILPSGAMVYKQIEIADRELMQGTLILDKDKYKVLCDDRLVNVPYASITFFRAQVGDSITVIVPRDESKTWGAIETVVTD